MTKTLLIKNIDLKQLNDKLLLKMIIKIYIKIDIIKIKYITLNGDMEFKISKYLFVDPFLKKK